MDNINPNHYDLNGMQVWDAMLLVFGKEKLIAFCELNAFKYRMRAGKKSNNIEEDIKKALRYEDKIKELWETTTTETKE